MLWYRANPKIGNTILQHKQTTPLSHHEKFHSTNFQEMSRLRNKYPTGSKNNYTKSGN